MNYRENIINLIDKIIEELNNEIKTDDNDKNLTLLNRFLNLKSDLSKIIVISNDEIEALSKILSNNYQELYNALVYIKTVELGKVQGIDFMYGEKETEFLKTFFASVEDKFVNLEEELLQKHEQEQSLLSKLDMFYMLKEELNNSDEMFTQIDELVLLLKEDGMSIEEINKILVNLITDNYNVSTLITKEEEKDEKVDIENCLKENNIKLDNIDDKELQIILSNPDVPYIIEFLKKENLVTILKNQPVLINVLAYSSKKIIFDICDKFKKLQISIRELNKIPTILINKVDAVEKSEESEDKTNRNRATKMATGKYIPGAYNRFIANISLLEEYGIKIDGENLPYSVLVAMPQTLEENIETSLKYKLVTEEDIRSIDYLGRCSNLSKELDKYIEQGAYYYACKNKSRIFMHDKNLFYRMYYARKNGIGMFKENSQSKYASLICIPQYFPNGICLIGDMNIKDGLGITDENASVLVGEVKPDIDYKYFDYKVKHSGCNYGTDNNVVRYLDAKYMENEFVYNINGVIISRLKFIRNINALNDEITYESLMYSLTSNTIIDEFDLRNLESLIEEILPRKRGL